MGERNIREQSALEVALGASIVSVTTHKQESAIEMPGENVSQGVGVHDTGDHWLLPAASHLLHAIAHICIEKCRRRWLQSILDWSLRMWCMRDVSKPEMRRDA